MPLYHLHSDWPVTNGCVAKYAGRTVKEIRDEEQISVFEARKKATVAHIQKLISEAETLNDLKVAMSLFVAVQTGYGY